MKNILWKRPRYCYLGVIYLLLGIFPVGAKSPALVEFAPVQQATLQTLRNFSGTVYFNQSARLASPVEGLVRKIYFDATQKVKKGTVLAELDHRLVDAKIVAIRENLEEIRWQREKANKDFVRYQKLFKEKNVSQQTMDDAWYQEKRLLQQQRALQARLQEQTILQQQAQIIAPFDGIISKRHIELGEWVKEGGDVATLVNPDKIDVLFDIPWHYVQMARPGTELPVKLAGKEFIAIIMGVMYTGDQKTRTVPLRLQLQNHGLPLFQGMEASIALPESQQQLVLQVPRDAVIQRFGGDVVFIAENGMAKMLEVKVLEFKNSTALLDSKQLKMGMMVVSKGNERLYSDQAIHSKTHR